jgi:hypothetical protein
MKVVGLIIFALIGLTCGKILSFSDLFENNEIEGVRQDPPPDYKAYAKMGRYLVHNSGIYLRTL